MGGVETTSVINYKNISEAEFEIKLMKKLTLWEIYNKYPSAVTLQYILISCCARDQNVVPIYFQ